MVAKRIFLLSICIIMNVLTIQAQLDSKMTTGVIAYQQGDYEKALETLNIGLTDISQLKEKNIPKAYYYRGSTMLKLLNQSRQSNNPDAQAKYQYGALAAAKDFFQAQETDDGKWGAKIKTEFEMVYYYLLQDGLAFLNQANNQLAFDYLSAASKVKETSYVAFDLLAQAELNLGDPQKAYSDFTKCMELFQKYPPEKPDLLIGYVYYRAALIQRNNWNDSEVAMTNLDEGLLVVESQWKKYLDEKSNYESSWEQISAQYQGVVKDFNAFKLDLFLNNPEKHEEAVKAFEQAIKDDPDNYMVHVAYAQLLEKSGSDKAYEIYKAAIDIDPAQEIAYFNLGALLNNVAKTYYDQSNEESDYQKVEQLTQLGNTQFEESIPYFEKCLEINPGNTQAIGALKQIYLLLNRMDDYQRIKEKE